MIVLATAASLPFPAIKPLLIGIQHSSIRSFAAFFNGKCLACLPVSGTLTFASCGSKRSLDAPLVGKREARQGLS